jgi:carboxymethylenebutenolidase
MKNGVVLDVSDGTRMQAYVARPSDALGTERGALILQEAFGVNDYIRRVADRLAAMGYLTIAPELFHRTHPGFDADYEAKEGVADAMAALTPDGQTADMRAAHDWLGAEGVPEGKTVAIGFCMGGRAAYLANSALPLAAAVSFYGGGITELLDRAGALHAPQLLIWGGQDAHILPDHRRAVADALARAGRPYAEATFSPAGHGFACDARGSYHAPSAREAWALADAFLAEHV